ncbi:transposase [Litoribrevibacter albus]|uniref:Transposase n=1 Tax=Litoribrevibacter albus TaxID=1473156 RepID=A0AA37S946_9GAMM|nr:transposase [Litoribrevibacter albus]GLQ30377.1 transposase [Litoribrevibacter albus]
MPKPRKAQISLDATPYYHCVSRCVRRAFLCGLDDLTGKSYEHRRGWLENKLLSLPAIFAIDIAAYAIMSNHYHVVLYVDAEQAKNWTDYEVAERWHKLFRGSLVSTKFLKHQELTEGEKITLGLQITKWRERLQDISWFMRVLNEAIAREANREDQCSGRFWEGRFKSQALLDEKALLACMAYVDLNPVRAKIARTPEHSDHTSIKKRYQTAVKTQEPNPSKNQVKELLPFTGYPNNEQKKGLPVPLTDYLALVDWTGRIVREDKCGALSNTLPPILDRLSLDQQEWLRLSQSFETSYKTFAGDSDRIKLVGQLLGYQRVRTT